MKNKFEQPQTRDNINPNTYEDFVVVVAKPQKGPREGQGRRPWPHRDLGRRLHRQIVIELLYKTSSWLKNHIADLEPIYVS